LAFGARRLILLWWEHKWGVKAEFTCDTCHREVYQPVYRSMHVGDKHYCQACEADWFAQAGVAVRERHAK
jgi:hypothetical protein